MRADRALLMALGLVACAGSDSDDRASESAVCGDSAPTVLDLSIEDGGPWPFDGITVPSLMFTVDALDEDADLTSYGAEIWWDDDPDGAITVFSACTEDHDCVAFSGSFAGENCSVSTPTLELRLGVTGRPPFDTEVDFGVVVSDAGGLRSSVVVVSMRTPVQVE